jgi:hypothetical protein
LPRNCPLGKAQPPQPGRITLGTAALADLPPVKLIAGELGIPERTASDWIQKARAAGWLTGLNSNIGRPAHG